MKKKSAELSAWIHEIETTMFQHKIWKHYKGGIYKILGLTVDTNDGTLRVHYKRIDGPDFDPGIELNITYVRPMTEWFEDVLLTDETTFYSWAVKRFTKVRKVEEWREVR